MSRDTKHISLKRLLLATMTVLAAVGPAAAHYFEYFINEGGVEKRGEWDLKKKDNNARLYYTYGHVEMMLSYIPDKGTKYFYKKDAVEGTEVEAERKGDIIELKGIYKNEPIVKFYHIDARPWLQNPGVNAPVFIAAGKEGFEFWMLKPDELVPYEMYGCIRRDEKIKVAGRDEETVVFSARPCGLLSFFVNIDYWARKYDYAMMKARVSGPFGQGDSYTEMVRETK